MKNNNELLNDELVDDGDACVCGKVYIEDHSCPFQEDVMNDSQYHCNCCSYCSKKCAEDI